MKKIKFHYEFSFSHDPARYVMDVYDVTPIACYLKFMKKAKRMFKRLGVSKKIHCVVTIHDRYEVAR